jgi:hypothetical protein
LCAVPCFKQEGILDKIQITYSDPKKKNYRIYIYMQQQGCTANFESAKDAQSISGRFWTASAEGINLFVDYRPYSDYYTDIPIGITIKNTGEQKLAYKEISDSFVSLSVATAIELRDTADESLCHDFMTKGDYTFSVNSEKKISTYYLRIWGANRVKENTTDADWDNPDAWEGGKSPQSATNAYVFIPASAQVKSSLSKKVDTINNEGTLIIAETGNVTVEKILNKGVIRNSGILNSGEIILY